MIRDSCQSMELRLSGILIELSSDTNEGIAIVLEHCILDLPVPCGKAQRPWCGELWSLHLQATAESLSLPVLGHLS